MDIFSAIEMDVANLDWLPPFDADRFFHALLGYSQMVGGLGSCVIS
jgi:hypothetical protein